ncbi:MAG TPA: DUF6580 family putative transport protein [Chitinophagaceae bacterium]
MKTNSRLLIYTLVLIAVTTASKVIFSANAAWSGVSPVIAIALFSGMLINRKQTSFMLPLLALLASDVIVQALYTAGLFDFPGFYSYQLLNYALILAVTFIGWALKGKKYGSIILGGIIAPTLFFLLSNFAAWMIDTTNLYTNDFAGLVNCYVAGIPFYGKSLASTMVFLPAILLGYNYMINRSAKLKLA